MAASATASVDSMLADAIAKMDALNKRMDALETTTKNPIKGDDDDDKKDDATKLKTKIKDDDDDDDDKKDDAFVAKKALAKDDDDDDKKDDAFPPKKKDDSKKADAKKKGDDGELEIKHEPEKKEGKEDSAKSDDDDDKKDDSKKSDDDDDKKKDDSRADDIGTLRKQIADQASVISKLQALMKPRSDDEHAAFADAQAKADSVFNGFGKRAPRPLEGESLMDYRKRLATALKPYSTMWKNSKLSRMDDDTFANVETQIYTDAATAAATPIDLGEGELRMVTKVNPATNQRYHDFYGKESFVKKMGRPGRRVQSFRTLASQ